MNEDQEEERQSLLSNTTPERVKIEDDDPATTATFTTSKLIKIATITALATMFATYGYVSESKKFRSLSSSELGHRQTRGRGGGDADDFSRKPSSSYSSARLGRWSSARDDDEDDDRYSSRRSSSRGRDDFDDDRRGGRGNYYAKYRDEDDDEYEKRGRGQRRDLGKDEDEDNYSKNKHSSSKYDDDDENDRKSSCLSYTSPSPRDGLLSRMPSSA